MLLRRDPHGGFPQRLMAFASIAAIAVTVEWNFKAQRHRPEVSHFAVKLDGRPGIAVFQFPLSGTRSAEILDPASGTFRGPPFLFADMAKERFPTFLNAAFAQTVQILL